MRFTLMLVLHIISLATEPGDAVVWLNFPAQKAANATHYGPVLTDIEEHLPAHYGTQYRDADPVTWAHETTHGIHSELRNNYSKGGNGFYCLNGRACLLKNPRVRLSQVAAFVPQQHRLMRFGTYLQSQASVWDDTPTYILDEWVAYTNGCACAIDREKVGLSLNHGRDAIVGPVEFIPYVLALCLAIERHDPAYLQGPDGTQFKELVAHELRRAVRLYQAGMAMPRLRWEQELPALDQSLMDVARRWYGAEFCRNYLGGP